jgi:ATP-dependent Clp protease ATP-binding subunit ClpA
VRDRRSEHARRVLDLAMWEADGLGHRYLGPEHVLLGVLRDGTGAAAQVLRAYGLELLGALGIDLDEVRRRTEQTFGALAVQRAMREATRARRRGNARVPRTPLEGPPLLIGRTLLFARERADALGHCTVDPELLLLGVLDDITRRWPRCMSNRWRRRLLAHVGLPAGYRGAARPLLDAFGVDLEKLRDDLMALLRGARR